MDEQTIDGDPDLVVRLDLAPPEGTTANVLDLQYSVITREFVTHSTLVSVRTDWKSGVVPD
ncbi:MAG: hypothetical protein ACRYHQ_13590 [Janthinobacterium lividum]